MRERWIHPLACVVMVAASALPTSVQAQQQDPAAIHAELDRLRGEPEALRQAYDQRLQALEATLAQLERAAAPGVAEISPPPTSAPGPDGALPVYGNVNALSKVFNPDMAVIGNFIGTAGTNSVDPSPALSLHEVETSLQAVVDPYARADFFVAIAPDGVDIEEGFITFPALPGGLLLKAGKQRSAFGKVNALHAHLLPWADRPIVATNLLGGDEPMAGASISVARLVPNPWTFLEMTGEARVPRWYSGCSETRHDRRYRREGEPVTAYRSGYRVIVGVTALLLLGGWQMGRAEQAVLDDPVRAFVSRVEAYARLHQRLERRVPAFGASADPLSRLVNRGYLASAIRAARSRASQGDIFTPEVADLFRTRLKAVPPDVLAALPGEADAIHVNEPLREEASHSVPPVSLEALPPLPGGIEYRIVGSALVLWDAHADLVIDVLPDAFGAPTAG